jgi:RNA polymerase sigma-70 factor (ECF subfamily)
MQSDGFLTAHPPLAENAAVERCPLDFDRLYATHAGSVWRFLRSMRVRDSEVDDVFQEVFLVVARRLPEYDGRHRVTTWLYAICLRVSSAYRRRAWFRRERPSEHPPEPPSDPHAPPSTHDDALPIARRCLDALDHEKRAVFVLFEIEELPMTDVAAIVGCPLQTAYSRLYAARRQVEATVRRLRARGEAP